jgi:glycine/D-amino acid oxidase-like deaminating enzyme
MPGRRLNVDALIVGSGITGALVAYELAKTGAKVAITDSRLIASGSTPASTALLQYEIDTPLVKLTRMLGKKHAEAAYMASFHALADVRSIGRELGNDVELVPRRSLQLAVKRADYRAFAGEVKARKKIGIPVTLVSRENLRSRFGLDRPGAILNENALEVNPLKLTYRLLRAAEERGAMVLPRTRLDLSSLVEKSRPFRLTLPSGARIVAKHIVIATGYETPEEFAEIASLTELRSTFALATSPVRAEPWPERILLWDAGDPYFYARTTADGRVLAGGEDEPFTSAAARDALIAWKSRTLLKTLRKLIPELKCRAAFRWAGTFAQTKDGLPYIGAHHKWPGVHFALGYGGNGITFSVIASKILAESIAGRVHPLARLFRFDR